MGGGIETRLSAWLAGFCPAIDATVTFQALPFFWRASSTEAF
jgi:hypothetical protein